MRRGVVLVGVLVLAGCGGSDAMRVPEPGAPTTITVTSPAFGEGEAIPRDYTCRGAGRVPALAWRGVPGDAAAVAVVVSDPDAPKGTFVHWVVHGLAGRDGGLSGGQLPAGAREAENSAGTVGWYPPCPPSGVHRYRFTVYALGGSVSGRAAQQVLDDIARRAVALGTLTGVVAAG